MRVKADNVPAAPSTLRENTGGGGPRKNRRVGPRKEASEGE